MLLVYGPGTEHTAISPCGLGYGFQLAEWDQIEMFAEDLGPVTRPERGRVQAYPAMGIPPSVTDVFVSMRDPVDFGSLTMNDGFEAVTRLFADDNRAPRKGKGRRIDSRSIVGECVDHVDEVGSSTSIAELCGVAHVSERRLRQAFVDIVGLPPTTYFRCRALNRARLRLTVADARETHVTEVALDAGFSHVGRFAKQYQDVFGEYPSATLASTTN
jgi:AraC-like DNA-binding protein